MDFPSKEVQSKSTDHVKAIEKIMKSILHSSHYCTICYNTADLCNISTQFEMKLNKNMVPLKEMIREVFYNDTFLASPHMCKGCIDQIIKSYLFIHKAKETANIMRSYIDDFLSKVDDLDSQLDMDRSYDNSNVIVVLESNITPTEYDSVQYKINIRTEPSPNFKTSVIKDKEAKPAKDEILIKTIPEGREFSKRQTAVAKSDVMIARKEGYECVKCKVLFPKFKDWKEHERSSHTPKSVDCNICAKTFDNARLLTEHYKTHNKLKCCICNQYVLDKELTKHLKLNHSNDCFECEYCDCIYYTAPALTVHQKITHFGVKTSDEDNPQCLMCLQYFSKNDLKTHKCKDKCLDCLEMPCIHHKYLLNIKEQMLNHKSKIKCLDCNYVSRRKDALITHVNREHLDHHPFECDHCGTQFYSKFRLKCHIVSTHSNRMCCKFCDKWFNYVSPLKAHEDMCQLTRRQYACNECDASFDTCDDLYNHQKIKHSGESYPCEFCNKVFLSEEVLAFHRIRAHRKVQMVKKMNWECLLCGLKFDTKGEYRIHMDAYGPDVAYVCRICHVEQPTLQKLQWHQRMHRDKTKKLKKCEVCGKEVFALRAHMYRHRVSIDPTLISTCDECGKPFPSKIQLRIHKKIHLPREPCKVCKKMVKPSNMWKHLRMHLDKDKPKERRRHQGRRMTSLCQYCGYVPSSIATLEAHVNRYHLNIKPYICSVCGDGFCAEFHLKQHERIHNEEKNYTCDVCGLKLRFKNSLTKHVLLHTGQRSYICDICGDGLICASALQEHKLKHFEKSVMCPLCDTMFHSLKLMRMHFKKQHWKDKSKVFNPKEILDEKYHHLFVDRRKNFPAFEK